MDLYIYNRDSFYSDGKLSVSIHQKETNKFMYIPFCSFHQRHTIKNYVWGELKRYVCYNMEEKILKKLKTRFFLMLRNRGFKKMFSKSYFNTSHIRKGINCSTQNSLFLLFVIHLLSRKQRTGLFRKGRKYSASRKRQRQFPTPSHWF